MFTRRTTAVAANHDLTHTPDGSTVALFQMIKTNMAISAISRKPQTN
jgi:hypothetical protein